MDDPRVLDAGHGDRGASGSPGRVAAQGQHVEPGHREMRLREQVLRGFWIAEPTKLLEAGAARSSVPEEVVERAFADVLGGLAIDDKARRWVKESLRDGRHRQKQVHEEALAPLKRDQETLEARSARAREDELDGAIELHIYERKTSEWQDELGRIGAATERHEAANRAFLDEGVM